MAQSNRASRNLPATNGKATKMTIKWDTYTCDVSELPAISVQSLVQQAVNHRMSNMVDANVNQWIRTEKLGLKGSNAKDATTAEKAEAKAAITQWRTDNADEYKVEKTAAQKKMWQEMLDGFVLNGRGPRLDPVTKEYNGLVLARARARFAEVSTEDFPAVGKTATLKNGSVMSREAMIEAIESREGNELMMRAESIVDARNAKTSAPEPVDASGNF